jgi:hypothetical protein
MDKKVHGCTDKKLIKRQTTNEERFVAAYAGVPYTAQLGSGAFKWRIADGLVLRPPPTASCN